MSCGPGGCSRLSGCMNGLCSGFKNMFGRFRGRHHWRGNFMAGFNRPHFGGGGQCRNGRCPGAFRLG